jgi:L-fuconolactonase
MPSLATGIIDSHIHLWQLEIASRDWLTSKWKPLYRSFGPTDLEAVSAPAGVTMCVQIEAGQTPDANAFLEQTAASARIIGAIVPWVDIESPVLECELVHWQSNLKFRGVRVQVENHPDPNYLAREAVIEGLGKLAARGLTFDFLVRTGHLKHLVAIYERYPGLRGVIDHMAKPDIATGQGDEEWKLWMSQLAGAPNLFCKISGLLTEAGEDRSVERIKPYVQFVIEKFGFDRVMWGSDWPVAVLTADYTATFDTVRETLGPIDSADEVRLYRETATRFYNLQVSG